MQLFVKKNTIYILLLYGFTAHIDQLSYTIGNDFIAGFCIATAQQHYKRNISLNQFLKNINIARDNRFGGHIEPAQRIAR